MRWLSLFSGTLLTTQSLFGQFNACDYEESRFHVGMEYLIWYAHQEGMSYATLSENNYSSVEGIYDVNEKDLFFSNRWDSGVRASLGFKPSCHSWDTRFVYSYFNTSVHPKDPFETLDLTNPIGRVDLTSGGVVIPDYYLITIPPPGSSANETATYSLSTVWKLNFNELDLEFGTDFNVACDVGIRAFFGMRSLFANQLFRQTFLLTNTLSSNGVGLAILKEQNNFSGFGPRTGFDLTYNVGYGLDLYGNFAAGILWGWFSNRQSIDIPVSGLMTPSLYQREAFVHSHQSSVLSMDATLGIRWSHRLNCGANLLTLQVGWEEHLYTNMNQFQNFIYQPTVDPLIGFVHTSNNVNDRNVQRGDLSLSGLAIGFSYSF